MKARAASAATGAPALADDSGIEAEALGGAPGVLLRPLRRAEPRPTPRTATSCAPRCRPARGLRYVCAVAYVAPGEEPRLAEGALRGPHGRGAARRARLRLRPALRPRRRRRHAHDGRALRRREGPHLAPRARRTGGGGMARRRSDADGPGLALARGRALDRLELRADRAQDRGRRGHRLGRDHHRGDPLRDRPARLDRRLLLRPPGRDAGRRLAPLRPREVRERRGRHRGHADPRRLGRDRLHRGQPPRRGHGDRVARLRHRASSRSPRRSTWSSRSTSTAARPRPTRPPWPATPRTCAPTRSRRSACSSASRSSASPARPGSTRSSRS